MTAGGGESLRAQTVVGVMPPDFQFPDAHVQYWMPIAFSKGWDPPVLARLADGATPEAAAAEAASIVYALRGKTPEAAADAQRAIAGADVPGPVAAGTLSRRAFANENLVGQTVVYIDWERTDAWKVIGVVDDVKQEGLDREPSRSCSSICCSASSRAWPLRSRRLASTA